MPVVALILISLVIALIAYLWYITPDPKDVAEQVLRQCKRKKASVITFAKPQPNLTHIDCLS